MSSWTFLQNQQKSDNDKNGSHSHSDKEGSSVDGLTGAEYEYGNIIVSNSDLKTKY